MKIAVFHNVPPGGAKRVVYEEVKYLSKKYQIDIYKYTSNDENFLDIRPFGEKVKVYNIDIKSKLSGFINRLEKDFKNFFILERVSEEIAQEINNGNYDVVLVHPDKFTQSPYILKFLTIPSVYYCHELLRIAYENELVFTDEVSIFNKVYENITRRFRKRIDKTNAKNSSLVIANSKYTSKKIRRFYGKKSEVIFPGVDVDVFKSKKDKSKKKKILFIGEKNFMNGYPLYKNIVEEFRNDKQVDFENISFSRGKVKVSDNDLVRKYSESMVVLCLSQNEPFGIIPLESMACETPVLAVDDGGYKETVIDGVTGYLLQRDPKVFAEKMEYLLENPNIIRKMGRAGREHVKKNFTWNNHNNKLERLLVKLAHES